jgi:hypothetical protein
MGNRPFYSKLYQDMIREKYPEKEACCRNYLKKKRWTALDVIEVNTLLFGSRQKQEEIASNQKHRAYDRESIVHILRYQQQNKLNNNQLAGKFRLSRNTISKWRKLFGEKIGVGTINNT